MSKLEAVYARSPVAMQHAMATGFGAKERVLRHGGRFRSFCDELEHAQWLGSEALHDIQGARLRSMVSFCADSVPYYKRLFDELDLVPSDIASAADLRHLPVLDKEEVRRQPDQFRPNELRERAVGQTTGGTTGTPLRYWVTPSAMQYSYATYEVRFRNWAGVALGDRMASINGRKIIPDRQTGPPFWRHNLAFNQLYLSAYHLTDEHLPLYVDRLRAFDPKVVVGYVSTIHLLAQHILSHNLQDAVRPRAVLVSSETLFPWMRKEIEEAFGCTVLDGYGLGEMSAFITECPRGSMHISPEYGVVEGVDIGGETHLVGTGLINRAMPLLRYDTGDVVNLGTPAQCPCGRGLPSVQELLGRADDYVVTPDGRRVGPAPLSLAFQTVTGIREAQIRQEVLEEAIVLLVVDDDFDTAAQALLERELRHRVGDVLRVVYERVEFIPRTTWGKRRLVDSAIGRRAPS